MEPHLSVDFGRSGLPTALPNLRDARNWPTEATTAPSCVVAVERTGSTPLVRGMDLVLDSVLDDRMREHNPLQNVTARCPSSHPGDWEEDPYLSNMRSSMARACRGRNLLNVGNWGWCQRCAAGRD